MGTDKGGSGLFEKVRGVECLYRYRLTGAYYARFQVNGKEVRKSLRTSDKQIARRELARVQGDQSRNRSFASEINAGWTRRLISEDHYRVGEIDGGPKDSHL